MSDYKLEKNSKGLNFIQVPVKGTKTVTVLVMVKTGSKYETKKNNGISHFLEHMFFKGTKKRPSALALATELDALGGEYNAFTSKEYTGYWIKADYRKADKVLDIVSDMLLNSKFETEEINKEKGVILEEINMYESNPMMHIEDLFEECLYGDTPAGWDTIGTRENVSNFSRQTFLSYFNSQYSANNVNVILGGRVNEAFLEKAKKHFSDFQKSKNKDKKKVQVKQTKPQLKTKKQKTEQVNLSLGVHGMKIGDKDEFVLRVLGIILGGSMSSRLFSEVRERQGLAYYVKTMPQFYSDSGYLTTEAGVKPGNELKALKIILREYDRLKNELVSEEELKRNKEMIKGRMSIQLEGSDNLANWYGKQSVYRKDFLKPSDFIEKIEKVEAKDIKRVAQKIFVNEKLNLALIGPFKNLNNIEKNLKF